MKIKKKKIYIYIYILYIYYINIILYIIYIYCIKYNIINNNNNKKKKYSIKIYYIRQHINSKIKQKKKIKKQKTANELISSDIQTYAKTPKNTYKSRIKNKQVTIEQNNWKIIFEDKKKKKTKKIN